MHNFNPSTFMLEIQILLSNCHLQPSQNVPAAGNFAAYNEISAAYFTLKFITNTRSLVVQIVTKGPQPLLPTGTCITPAILPTTPKHFDWAALGTLNVILVLRIWCYSRQYTIVMSLHCWIQGEGPGDPHPPYHVTK